MKFFIVISALVAVALAKDQYYHTGNDHLDVDKVMHDPAVVKRYIDCYIDLGPCDPLALSYKIIMHESLKTACTKCSPSLRHMWYRFLWDLKQNYPQEYDAYKRKYDPEGILIPALIKVVSLY